MPSCKNVLITVLLLVSPQVLHANVEIEFSEIGSDLFFSWSGVLNVSAGDGVDGVGPPLFATIGVQGNGDRPTFYSSPSGFDYVHAGQYTVLGNNAPGLFALNAPTYTTAIMPGAFGTGTDFLFRVSNAFSGAAAVVDLWGDWGAANTPFAGTLTIPNESIASLGLVDGYTLSLDIGDISFRSVNQNSDAVPEPASALCLTWAAFGIASLRRRRE